MQSVVLYRSMKRNEKMFIVRNRNQSIQTNTKASFESINLARNSYRKNRVAALSLYSQHLTMWSVLLQADRYAPILRDSMYLYLMLLDEILEEEDDPRDGRVFFEKSKLKTFQGLPCGMCYKWEYNKKITDVTIFNYVRCITVSQMYLMLCRI